MRLIFDSGKMWSSTFFRNKNFKKGGADSYIWDAVMIMSKNAKMTSETLIRVSYYGIFGRNQYSERLPPLLPPPFSFIPIEWKNQNFPLFRGRTQYSWVPRWRCPPLFEFLESPKHYLQILYVSFFVKMCCFCSRNPGPKNELAILLWKPQKHEFHFLQAKKTQKT